MNLDVFGIKYLIEDYIIDLGLEIRIRNRLAVSSIEQFGMEIEEREGHFCNFANPFILVPPPSLSESRELSLSSSLVLLPLVPPPCPQPASSPKTLISPEINSKSLSFDLPHNLRSDCCEIRTRTERDFNTMVSSGKGLERQACAQIRPSISVFSHSNSSTKRG